MNKIKELEAELSRLRIEEDKIINSMRYALDMEYRIKLLCELEVVRYDINPIRDEYIDLLRRQHTTKESK